MVTYFKVSILVLEIFSNDKVKSPKKLDTATLPSSSEIFSFLHRGDKNIKKTTHAGFEPTTFRVSDFVPKSDALPLRQQAVQC